MNKFLRLIERIYTEGQTRRLIAKGLYRSGLLSKSAAYRLGLVERPAYAYGLAKAAVLAQRLGYKSICAIEFGVGAGNGLLWLERHAEWISTQVGVKIDVIGFDTGSGLPQPQDHRDLPFLWQPGFYPMDQQLLRSRLKHSELIIGNIATTVTSFLETRADSLVSCPIGFVSIDVDYWSSTCAALEVFRRDPHFCLPRVKCYFDDIVPTIEYTGELLAIKDFNAESSLRKLGQLHGEKYLLPFHPVWANKMFEAHLFSHSRYGENIADRAVENVVLTT